EGDRLNRLPDRGAHPAAQRREQCLQEGQSIQGHPAVRLTGYGRQDERQQAVKRPDASAEQPAAAATATRQDTPQGRRENLQDLQEEKAVKTAPTLRGSLFPL